LFTVWQGAWKHLRTTPFHIQHSYDRSEAAQSQLLTERPYMHRQTPQQRQEYPLQKFCFLPFTNGPCKLILIDKPVHLLKKSATVYSNLERSYFQNVSFSQLHEHRIW
jgi:hypothetical protein